MTNEIVQQPQIATTPQVAASVEEIRGAILMAKHFPRDYKKLISDVDALCKRETFARSATYSYPRGGSTITGPSVKLARGLAQVYGNIRYGYDLKIGQDDTATVIGWAWDLENNTRAEVTHVFKRLIQRKNKDTGETVWVQPDERDFRELVSKNGAISERNAILKVVGQELVEDATGICRQTIKLGIKDAKGEQKRLIIEFKRFGVSSSMLDEYVGSTEWSTDNIVELTEIYNSIKDGQTTRDDYFTSPLPSAASKSEAIAKSMAAKRKQDTVPQATKADVLKLMNELSGMLSSEQMGAYYIDDVELEKYTATGLQELANTYAAAIERAKQK